MTKTRIRCDEQARAVGYPDAITAIKAMYGKNGGKSAREIGNIYQVCSTTILHWLRAAGVEIMPSWEIEKGQLKYPADKLEAARRAGYASYDEAIIGMRYEKKMSYTDIGRVLDVTAPSIQRRLVWLEGQI